MIGPFKRKSKAEKGTAQTTEAKAAEAKTAEKKAPEAKAPAAKPKVAKAKKPGLFDTMRVGWTPPKRRPAARAAVASGASGAAAAKAAKTGGAATAGDGVALGGHPVKEPELLRQRDQLARQFAELQWDLGGITYEMASRDHFKMDVLLKQASKLQDVDARLGQVERLLRLDQEGAAGSCPACGALQARGAVFCWQCGKELTPSAKADAKPSGEKKTASEAKAAADTKAAAGKTEPAAKPEATK